MSSGKFVKLKMCENQTEGAKTSEQCPLLGRLDCREGDRTSRFTNIILLKRTDENGVSFKAMVSRINIIPA